MDQLFLQIINMSMTASYVILFVIALRLLLKRVPKIYSYTLWIIVLFRLVLPFSFTSVLSMIPMNTKAIPADIVFAPRPEIQSGITAIDRVVNSSLPAPVAGASVNPIQIWIGLGEFIWLVGILMVLVYSVLTTLKLTKKLKSSKHLKDNIYEVNHIDTPFVFGILRPKIYIPFGLSETEEAYIIKHEETHIRRYDHILKFIFFVATTIHWFNPLVWIAFFLMGKDMELSCDETVITEMGSEIKKDYSHSLLSLSNSKRMIGGSPLAFGGENTKGRIQNILNYKKPRFWATLVGGIVIVVAVIGLLSNPKEEMARDLGSNEPSITDDYISPEEPLITEDSTSSEELAEETNYDKISAYMKEKSIATFSPYYELLEFNISNYKEEIIDGAVHATFYYQIIEKNYDKDPDTVGYIKEAKENRSSYYQQMYDEYLEPRESNFDLKIIIDKDGLVTLYSNISPNGIEWEETQMGDYILSNSEVTDTPDQPDGNLVSVEGRMAIMLEDVMLENPYIITMDSENKSVYEKLNNTESLLNKNDLVIVIEEDATKCRVIHIAGDIPAIRGTIPKNKLSYDRSLFISNANQAIIEEAMGYDGINGNEIGMEYGRSRGIVLERQGDWVRVTLAGGGSETWFKAEDLSYEFDTLVTDIRQ